jgi:hypothetical protein
MKCGVEQKLFIYDILVQRSSWRKCRRKFHRKYPDSTVPCKAMIYNIVTKLRSAGSVLDKKKSRKRHVLTEEKLDDKLQSYIAFSSRLRSKNTILKVVSGIGIQRTFSPGTDVLF